MIDEGTTYGKGLADGAAARLKELIKKVLLRQSFDGGTVEFGDSAAKLKSDGINVLVSMLNHFQAISPMQALDKLGHTEISLVGGDTIKTSDMTKASGLVSCIAATSPVLNVEEFPNGEKFRAKFTERFKIPVTYCAHYSGDNMYILKSAIQSAQSADQPIEKRFWRNSGRLSPMHRSRRRGGGTTWASSATAPWVSTSCAQAPGA